MIIYDHDLSLFDKNVMRKLFLMVSHVTHRSIVSPCQFIGFHLSRLYPVTIQWVNFFIRVQIAKKSPAPHQYHIASLLLASDCDLIYAITMTITVFHVIKWLVWLVFESRRCEEIFLLAFQIPIYLFSGVLQHGDGEAVYKTYNVWQLPYFYSSHIYFSTCQFYF